jgi:Heliorhodopsin
MNSDLTTTASGVTPERLQGLRRWNLALTVLHFVQAIGIFVLTGKFAITVTSTFPEGPPGTRVPNSASMFDIPVGPIVGVFLLLAALDHFLTATVLRSTYESDLRRGINRFRWIEYSISATLMIILLSFYAGVTNVNAIVAVIGANVAMILFGWLQEVMNPPGRVTTTMTPFWFGTLVGITPWISILINVLGSKTIPGFVYGIIISEAIFFFSFGLNQWLQYKSIGKWTNYAFGEKTYLILSLIAKSILAWQIYGGSLDG